MSTTHNPGPALRRRSVRKLIPSELRVAHGSRGTGTIPAFLRRFVLASVVAAAATLSASAVVDPATAYAAPEWDIGAYDKCVGQADLDYLDGKISKAVHEERIRNCCPDTGGVSKPGVPLYDACGAPPASAPGRTVRPGVITQTLTPAPVAPPLGDITQTFSPAP
jgi:hypothetical protein